MFFLPISADCGAEFAALVGTRCPNILVKVKPLLQVKVKAKLVRDKVEHKRKNQKHELD